LDVTEPVLDAGGEIYCYLGDERRLRCGLHAGPLIVGEMGDIKREIVMLGDTMNTAARIEEACRTTGRDVSASSSLGAADG
jgi:adenylate cyclase